MTRALISVSDDGFTYISLNGATSRYSDTGQAIAYLGDYARETATALSVTIDDGAKKTEVSIDENGKLARSEEHTSELQSRGQLVCRLLLAKRNTRWRKQPTRGGCRR